MPFYRYSALDRQGKVQSGTIDASSEQDAKDRLRQQELMVASLDLADSSSGLWGMVASIFEKKVDQNTKIRFTKQLGVLMGSGIPLPKCFFAPQPKDLFLCFAAQE